MGVTTIKQRAYPDDGEENTDRFSEHPAYRLRFEVISLEDLANLKYTLPIRMTFCKNMRNYPGQENYMDLVDEELRDVSGEVELSIVGCLNGCYLQTLSKRRRTMMLSFWDPENPGEVVSKKLIGLSNEEIVQVVRQVREWTEASEQ